MAAEIAEQPAVWLRLLHEAESGCDDSARFPLGALAGRWITPLGR